MKAGTTELMKFKRLQRMLSESQRGTVGLLELLWYGTCRNCMQGDIGKFSNEEIAIICDWEHDPDTLVNALVECSWLDACEDCRLVIHDWDQHAPKYVMGNLKSRNLAVAIAARPKHPANSDPLKQPAQSIPPPSLVKSRQVKSSPTKSGAGAQARKKFIAPTVEEVAAYCTSRANSVDPHRFVDYYQAQGWKLSNGRAMVDWKAAVRGTWEKKTSNNQQSNGDPLGIVNAGLEYLNG